MPQDLAHLNLIQGCQISAVGTLDKFFDDSCASSGGLLHHRQSGEALSRVGLSNRCLLEILLGVGDWCAGGWNPMPHPQRTSFPGWAHATHSAVSVFLSQAAAQRMQRRRWTLLIPRAVKATDLTDSANRLSSGPPSDSVNADVDQFERDLCSEDNSRMR